MAVMLLPFFVHFKSLIFKVKAFFNEELKKVLFLNLHDQFHLLPLQSVLEKCG